MKTHKYCQSCGMPLKKDEKGGGTEADGSLSIKYCSYCYANGEFIQADFTLEQMTELVINKMKEMKIPGFLAKWMAKNIKNLERWKK